MAELANCMSCGGVFAKTMRNICPKCFEAEEKAFEIVYRFVREKENREATIMEVVEGTGIEERLIIKFIKENRLRTAQFPNLSYPCEQCGEGIDTGMLCNSCSQEFLSDVKNHKQVDKKESENKQVYTYYSLDKYNK